MAFDLQSAIKAGYTPTEITEFLASQRGFDIAAARQAGYTDQDLMAELTRPVKEASALEGAADSALALGRGLISGAKMVSDAFGADNGVSKKLDSAGKTLSSMESEERKAEKAVRASKIQAAEQSGSTGQEVKAYLGGFAEAPIDSTLEAVGTIAPTVAGLFIPGVRETTLARLAATVGLGSVQGAGAVKGSIMDAVERKLLEDGVSPETAAQAAAEAQSYTGENAGQIALGAGLGGVAGRLGVEGLISKGIGQQAAKTIAGRIGTGAIAEGAPEFVQGAQERVAANTAVQNQGYDVPTFQGAVGQGALEAVTGGTLGGGLAAMGSRQRTNTPAPVAPPADLPDMTLDAEQALTNLTQAVDPYVGAAPVLSAPSVDAAIQLAQETSVVADLATPPMDLVAKRGQIIAAQMAAQDTDLKPGEARILSQSPFYQEPSTGVPDLQPGEARLLSAPPVYEQPNAGTPGMKPGEARILSQSPVYQAPGSGLPDLQPGQARLQTPPASSGIAAQRARVDRSAASTTQALGAGTTFERDNALAQAAAALPQTQPGAAADFVDLTPMSPRQADSRLAIMRDEAANQGGDALSLTIMPHPTQAGALAIGRQALPDLSLPDTTPTVSPAAAQNRIESAALAGSDAQRRASDGPRQDMISRAMAAIEARGGVASPYEAEMLRAANMGQPFNRIDPSIGRPASTDEKLTAATGLPVGQEAGVGFGARADEQQRQAQQQVQNAGSMTQVAERAQANQQQAEQQTQSQIAAAAAPAPLPAADAVVTAFKTSAPLRTAEQSSLIKQAQNRYDAADFSVLQRAGESPALLGAVDKARLNTLRQAPAATPAPSLPRPARVGGVPVAQLTNAQLEQTTSNDALPAITRRGASIELMARQQEERLKQRAPAPGPATPMPTSTDGSLVLASPTEGKLAQPSTGRIITSGAKLSTQRMAPGSKNTIQDGGVDHEYTVADTGRLGVQGKLLQQIARIFGKRLVVFESDTLKADGFVNDGDNTNIFINAKSTMSPLAVFGHELAHLIKRDNPAAYRALEAVVKAQRTAKGEAAFSAEYDDNNADLLEELTSDLVGNRFQEASFWLEVFNEIRAQNPEKAQSIITRLGAALNKAVNAVMKTITQPGFNADQYVTDLNAVKAAVKDALVQYAQSQKQPAMQMEIETARAEGRINMNAGSAPATKQPFTYTPELQGNKREMGVPLVGTNERVTASRPRGEQTAEDRRNSLNAQRISPRLPTAVKATEDAMGTDRLQPDLASAKRDPAVFMHNIALMAKYPNFQGLEGTAVQKSEQMITQMKDNLVWLYKNWRPEYAERSRMWYVGGNRIATRMADRFNSTAERLAAVIAATSPQKDWFQNVSLAERIMEAVVNAADTPLNYGQAMRDARAKFRADKKTGEHWSSKIKPAVRQRIEGKTLREVYNPADPASLYDMAVWIRAWDESTNAPFARVITPEGAFTADFDKGKSGKPIGLRWQSFPTIVKTLQILQAPDRAAMSELIGANHKVRSFFNNIIAPFAGDDVTIDTHAVAASLLRPLGSSSVEVKHNFGSGEKGSAGPKNSAVTGLYGTYALYAEAYRRAAAEVDVLPREMQSITWEAVRGLFRPEQKNATIKKEADRIWRQVAQGELSVSKARTQISRLVDGIQDPAWVRSPAGSNEAGQDSSYQGELPGDGVPGRGSDRPAGGTRSADSRAVPAKLSRQRQDTAEDEYAAVEARYKDTPQWMKAPNGSKSKLTERQWVQVRTPSFKSWFGDWEKFAGTRAGVWGDDKGEVSKVVDDNGEPLVVYHGTDDGGFSAFNTPGGKARGDLGIWTTPNRAMAETYVKKGRRSAIELPGQNTLEELLDNGYSIEEDADGRFEVRVDNGSYDGVYDTRQEAEQHLVATWGREPIPGDGSSGYYESFVNLRNPSESDFEGALWNGERPGQYVVLDENGEQVSDNSGKMYFDDIGEAEDVLGSFGGESVESAPDHYQTTDGAVREARAFKNDGAVREARAFKNDGAIIRNVVDDGGGNSMYAGEPSDVFVAFKPEQLKSATQNTGEFGADTADMRFSKQRQTETPEFKSWSKGLPVYKDAADGENGRGVYKLYHATTKDFDEFIPGGLNPTDSGRAIWLAPTQSNRSAAFRVGTKEQGFRDGANTMPVYARFNRPLVIDDQGMLEYARAAFGGSEFPQLITDKSRDDLLEDYDSVIFDGEALGWGEDSNEYIVFDGKQIKSAIGNNGEFGDTASITKSRQRRNIFAQPAPLANWTAPTETRMDKVIYTMQDKQIDTKRVVQAIKDAAGSIADKWDAYLQEELYHGRTAKQTKDFLSDELRPLMQDMQMRGVTIPEFEEFLHNRHAEERNDQIASINPAFPDGGSGIDTADARSYLAGLDPAKRRSFDALATRVDALTKGTRDLLVASGLETQDTIDKWDGAYSKYVPLFREDLDFSSNESLQGTGQGYQVRGPSGKRATGSERNVVDILANIAMQRERAIVRSEKTRVAQAVYGMAVQNPNTDFWLAVDPTGQKDPRKAMADLVKMGINPIDAQNIIEEPTQPYTDPKTGLVTYRVNPLLRSSPNVLAVRIDGEEKYVFFNANDERSLRMAQALKNLDADQMGRLMTTTALFTRYFAAVNTQYNPIFGAVNFIRDAEGAIFNLTTTEIADRKAEVYGNVMPALRGIYAALRAERDGRTVAGKWADLWEEFQQEGGQTGFRDMFSKSEQRGEALQREIDRIQEGKVKQAGRAIFDWLSDYNETMENAVRLAAYQAAKDKGLSNQRAASIAKNLTVNFNRKGQIGTQAGALYAFFNAAVQGTSRLAETLTGPAGQKIIAGGLLLGTAQALLLAAAGFDEDEPPDYVKERNLIIPTGNGKYLQVPMPLGLNVIPNASRNITEYFLHGRRDPAKYLGNIVGSLFETFNPIGNAGWSVQTLTPTILDPLAALSENRDYTGKSIAKQDMSNLDPTPGYLRAKETASEFSKQLAYYLNLASGGTKYKPGVVSPTPDQLDYLIGQATGGVGREALKIEQTVTSRVTGEELPPYKVPLLGRFYGDTKAGASESNRFYENITALNKHENEIKGRQKNREGTSDYIRANPEARLYSMANGVERDVQELRAKKRQLLEKGEPKERVQLLEARISARMKRFNDRVREARNREPAEAAN